MRYALVLASVIVTGSTASCEHGANSWCEGDWLVDLVKICDGEGDSLEKRKCASGLCVDGDFGAECVLTTLETCTPETYYCKGNSWTMCGRSGHPKWEADCSEFAKEHLGYWGAPGGTCIENLGTAGCVHPEMPCDPGRNVDCVGDVLVQCGSTGYAVDFLDCSALEPQKHCVIQDYSFGCQE
jgi:hypothetical protein